MNTFSAENLLICIAGVVLGVALDVTPTSLGR